MDCYLKKIIVKKNATLRQDMANRLNPFNTLKNLNNDKKRFYYSLPALEEQGIAKIRRLPVSIRIILESLLRHCDQKRVTDKDVLQLAKWSPTPTNSDDVPFIVSRIILQDFTGVPLLVDLAAMRDAVAARGLNPTAIEPNVPVDLVVDHSVQVDRAGTPDSFAFNLKLEQERNQERYSFLKWGQQAFKTLTVVPPGIGIVHQVNLERLATVVASKEEDGATFLYPDTLVGTDSHTPMVNGLGVVGWGVGGIEAEAGMLGQPVLLQTPEVIGVLLEGRLNEGVTATDLTLTITEMLRREKVVGKFVEFFGEGAASLSVADRATIGNMAPEYGATIGFFPVDEQTLTYLRLTGREENHIALIKEYLTAQGLFGIPKRGEIDFTKVLELDLSTVQPCVAGPKRPQDRIPLNNVKAKFHEVLKAPVAGGGYGKTTNDLKEKFGVHAEGSFSFTALESEGGKFALEENGKPVGWSESEMVTNRPLTYPVVDPGYGDQKECDIVLSHGSVVIAAITSCTNTSNPAVMLAAGLVAKKAVEKGLKINSLIKTSLAPGSRVVTDYLEKTGLQKYLDALGFQLVAYGCTTCIGNSGPLDDRIEEAIKKHDIVASSVLSGNRNFEGRIHSAVKANFLMSPPLVVAFAIAGRINIDTDVEPLAHDKQGKPVFLKDLWPSDKEIQDMVAKGLQSSMFKNRYANILTDNPIWDEVETSTGPEYSWNPESTYIQNPPYFEGVTAEIPKYKPFENMRALAIFGDSVTTDHISPAGAFKADSPAGKYLLEHGVPVEEFNSYGSRRGNHLVMMRGTFANVRLRNLMADGKEGGFTKLMPDKKIVPIFDACEIYAQRKEPLIIFAGKDYGMGSSRDWAAKGPALMGVRAVVARSFERIHRSNLIGMGILPLEFENDQTAESLGITGEETFSINGFHEAIKPHQEMILEIKRGSEVIKTKVIARLDTILEAEYFRQGGILPFVLRQNLKAQKKGEN
jgi:aconitate hydratase